MTYPIGYWKCTKSTFRDFREGEVYECRLDNTGGPRIYTGRDTSWAPYWVPFAQRFCYQKYELNFEYIGPSAKEGKTLKIECEYQPDRVIVNGTTYITGAT